LISIEDDAPNKADSDRKLKSGDDRTFTPEFAKFDSRR